MWQYKAQFLSMILMIALGIGIFTGFNIEWYSLKKDTDAFFEKTGFADYRIADELGFSEAQRDDILAVSGVADATRYLSVNATVKDDSDILAITVSENSKVSGFIVTSGDAYDADSENGMWLSDKYAEENGIRLGDPLTLVYGAYEFSGKVKGLIKSGEYLICITDETAIMPDYGSFGYVYISPKFLESVLGTQYYPMLNVRSELEKSDFIEAADKALGYTALVISKNETISYAEAEGEMNEGKTMGSILPVLFLAIAILTMVTTMHRLTASEKTQIGTLKALGFKDRRITLHYTGYALTIGIVGTVLGVALGYWLGWFIMNPEGSMGTYIDMDDWSLYMPAFCWIVLAAMLIFLTLIGWLSVKSMLRGTAADALRPYTPKKVRAMRIEKTKLWKGLQFGTKWNLRDTLRHKARSCMTLIGVVGCTLLIVGSFGMRDTAQVFIDRFYGDCYNYTTKINLSTDGLTNETAEEIAAQYNGDWCASVSVQYDDRAISADVYGITHGLIRFLDEDAKLTDIRDDGVYVCQRLANEGLKKGDRITISPYGTDDSYTLEVAGVCRSLTEGVIMSDAYAGECGFPYLINTIYTQESSIDANDFISSTQSKQTVLDAFDTMMEIMYTMLFMLVIAAAVLGIVVLYNLGVMSYTERYREMATLKVIGFKDKKIGGLLISQNIWLTVIGVIIGIPLGILTLDYLIDALAGEYEMSLYIAPLTYVISVALAFGVSLLVGIMIAGKNKHINMVEALKGTE